MEYISVKQYAEKFNISERTARNYCASGKIDGAYLVGKSWNIPVDAVLPDRGQRWQSVDGRQPGYAVQLWSEELREGRALH